MKLALFVLVNALAVAAAAWMFDGIGVRGSGILDAARWDRWLTVAIVGVILGVVNRVVKPIVTVLALPAIILSLGLALLVVNALMLLLTGRIAEAVDLGFRVHGFWTAVGGAIVISITTMVLDALLPDPER